MRDEKQLHDLITVSETLTLLDIKILPVPKWPIDVAKEIQDFRDNYRDVDMAKVNFYTYDMNNMAIGIVLLKIIKEKWETEASWVGDYELTLSVYPAIEKKSRLLIFYFIPTWVKKGSLRSGHPMNGNIVDFVTHVKPGPDYPIGSYVPFYINEKGYIFDLGSSCP